MPQWLLVSIALSVVLTVVANVVLRLFPGAGRQVADGFERLAADSDRRADERGGSHARVIVPWKAMLIASIALTVALNVLLLLAR